MSASEHDCPIEVCGLVTSFGATIVHDHLDLTVRRGEILGVVGGTGTGKSVLLSVLIGLKQPDAGDVRIFGHDIYRDASGVVEEIKGRWGVLFQGNALFSNLNVRDNVGAPLVEHTRLPVDFIDEVADLKIALAGLPPETANMWPDELSGGMRKRAGVARALAMDPELMLLDEPTSGLDPIQAAQINELILGLSKYLSLTVVLITHDLDTLYAITDRVAVLADKKVVAIAPVAELRQSDHPWVHAYFGGARGLAAARSAKHRRPASAARSLPGAQG